MEKFNTQDFLNNILSGRETPLRGEKGFVISEQLFLSSESGDALAHTALGYMYSAGIFLPKNQELALKHWELGASKNVPEALFFLARQILSDNPSAKGKEKAASLLKTAIEMSGAFTSSSYRFQAEIMLGSVYFYGIGVKENHLKALQLFEKVALEGHENTLVCSSIGRCYLDGLGTTQNLNKALYWFKKAAKLGDTESLHKVAEIYIEQGDVNGVGEMWLLEGAVRGDKKSMLLLAETLLGSKEKNIKKTEEAMQWLRKYIKEQSPIKDGSLSHAKTLLSQAEEDYLVLSMETGKKHTYH